MIDKEQSPDGASPFKSKPVIGWVLYDWANSAFALTVIATFYPVFFRSYWSAGSDPAAITSRLALATAVGSALVALIAPVLGAVADAGGARKKFLSLFTLLAIASTLGLYFVAQGDWPVALGLYVIALFGFYSANTFYDSLIINVTARENFERVSAAGFGIGYLGSSMLLGFNVWMVSNPTALGFADGSEAVRFAFALVAGWWALFSVPLFLFVREEKHESPPLLTAVVSGYRTLIGTFKNIREYKNLATFLLAYWLYIDGVHTLILMATDFGARLNFSSNDLVMALLVTNIVGVPATLAFGWLGGRIGPKRAIYLGVGVYLLIALWGLMLESVWQYYAMAIGVGLVQGGVQSMSRALYARLTPPEKASEFFGFYSMLGKFAAILGPTLIGLLAMVSDNPKVSVLVLIPLFIGGLLLLSRVEVPDE
ncbi:MAG: MFS transporter [Pseudomonadota bacterium]